MTVDVAIPRRCGFLMLPCIAERNDMSAARQVVSRARRYFDVFEDSWKSRHKAAMECRDFEDDLGEAARVFDLVHDLICR